MVAAGNGDSLNDEVLILVTVENVPRMIVK